MQNLIYIFIGGGIGSVFRYLVQGIVFRIVPSSFPYGTLTVNIVGSFLIGFFVTFFEEKFLISSSLRLFLTIGILGGFTTFSSFSFETITLLKNGEVLNASMNIVISVSSCLIVTYGGMLIGKSL